MLSHAPQRAQSAKPPKSTIFSSSSTSPLPRLLSPRGPLSSLAVARALRTNRSVLLWRHAKVPSRPATRSFARTEDERFDSATASAGLCWVSEDRTVTLENTKAGAEWAGEGAILGRSTSRSPSRAGLSCFSEGCARLPALPASCYKQYCSHCAALPGRQTRASLLTFTPTILPRYCFIQPYPPLSRSGSA
ncbi:hypothetical protein AAT19DRAFT_14000 [Rhodotorula toruloides]|uniref:Uncharacterized protein n=1 Tax=Rhodotorula toruloides TaxID=5286 RepID=A0A2T0AAE8_RHOTO|nr:hypothetical protein AAT19DRAFT_14000 [Rhodotorula toruloides]